MTAAMIMPHLILAKTKNESDGSVTKTILRRLDQWIKGDFHNLFNEARALQVEIIEIKVQTGYR